MFKVTIDGETHEVSPSNIKGEDGFSIITPDSIPDGYVSKEAMDKMMKDRLKKATENKESDLLEDESFQKRILSKYNIVLDESGKPKGLEPTVDPDEIRSKVTEQVSSEYEGKLTDLQKEIEKRNQAVIESAIMSAVSGNYREDWTKSFDDEKPLAVKQFSSRIGVDDQGRDVVLDEDGNPRYKQDGSPMRAKDYLLNEEKFGQLMMDKRQRGSDFGNTAPGGNGVPKGDPSKWKREKKLAYIKENGQDGYKKLLKERTSADKEE